MIAKAMPFWRRRTVEPLAAPQSRAAEAYRRLRTMVDLAAGEQVGVRLVVSPGAGDGTTTVMANIGVALASTARPVLLIDGNLYRPQLHTFFGISNDVGLTSVLSGHVPLAAAIQTLPAYPGVRVLAAGPPVLDPATLLSGPAAERTMAAATQVAPVVFVDGPPLLPVTGGVVLAGLAAGVLVVARAGRTSSSQLEAALDLVEQTGTPVLGVVLNAVRGTHAGQPGYQDRRYSEQRTPDAAPPSSSDVDRDGSEPVESEASPPLSATRVRAAR